MLKRTFKGKTPIIANNAFIAETAALIGDVEISNKASIWYGVVIRADVNKVIIGERTNIQDNSVVHTDTTSPVVIGNDVTIGHGCIIHGCTIEDGALIGMGAIILNGAVIKKNAVVSAGSLVPQGKVVEANTLVMGSPISIVKDAKPELLEYVSKNKDLYVDLGQDFLNNN